MRNLYQEVTDEIVAPLAAGTPAWIKPWSATPGLNVPCNAVTGRPYSGINVLLLWIARDRGWSQPRFLDFKQATEAGGHVRKGEHGHRVVFVKDLVARKESGPNEDETDAHHVRMMKTYVVFNVAQCDDLPEKITRPPAPQHHDMRDLTIEEFLAATGASIREGDRASYSVDADLIRMPPFGAFTSASAYYGTLFHELVHWTAHPSRLARDLGERFSAPGQRYAAEELIAELGNAFLCAEFATDGYSDHASYISSWAELLTSDTKAIFTCASKAQAAVDYLRDLVLREPAQAAE